MHLLCPQSHLQMKCLIVPIGYFFSPFWNLIVHLLQQSEAQKKCVKKPPRGASSRYTLKGNRQSCSVNAKLRPGCHRCDSSGFFNHRLSLVFLFGPQAFASSSRWRWCASPSSGWSTATRPFGSSTTTPGRSPARAPPSPCSSWAGWRCSSSPCLTCPRTPGRPAWTLSPTPWISRRPNTWRRLRSFVSDSSSSVYFQSSQVTGYRLKPYFNYLATNKIFLNKKNGHSSG